jgi:hypothetical protein
MAESRRVLPRIFLTVVGAALVVVGVIAIGEHLRDSSGAAPSSQLAVTDIECDPPRGKSRGEFLSEVHYYGRLPEKLNAADPDLPDRLRAAFLKHPKVERVDKLTVTRPNKVRVDLVYKP